MADLQVTGRIVSKRYKCTHCGHLEQVSTNHYGEIYSQCSKCSWKRPGQATIKECMEGLPAGWGVPEKWKVVTFQDLVEVNNG